ncbi:MAG: hypothetical protein JNJ54_16215 [Myxococcaceae bacterium]|nr:hypothetical protein [Myxococcaceae bacterium]
MSRLLLTLAVVFAPVALADLIPPSEAECRQKKAGDACRADLGEGVCTAAKCSRNDYSEGPPPKQKVVDCLKCLPPAAADAGVAAKKAKAKK